MLFGKSMFYQAFLCEYSANVRNLLSLNKPDLSSPIRFFAISLINKRRWSQASPGHTVGNSGGNPDKNL